MTTIPISYNLRNLGARWTNTLVAVLGIAGVVGVFVATISMANGFRSTLKASGSPDNVMLRRAGSNAELESGLSLEQAKVAMTYPQVAAGTDGQPLGSPEVVVVAALPMITTGTDANVQVRGVSKTVWQVRPTVRITAGRTLTPGLPELNVGKNAASLYRGLELGGVVAFGGQNWTVVGLFDAGGSAFDSEIWADATVLNEGFQRPKESCQSITLKLKSADDFTAFKDAASVDPRLTVTVERESDYYRRQSKMVETLIRVLGYMVASVMAIGAVFGALNTMYSSVSARSREVATLRALGFSRYSIVLSFTLESICISTVGAVLGCLLVIPLNGYTASTINWSTFSHLGFAFQITPTLVGTGFLFAWLMGFLGGFFPALRAARQSIPTILRGL